MQMKEEELTMEKITMRLQRAKEKGQEEYWEAFMTEKCPVAPLKELERVPPRCTYRIPCRTLIIV